MINESFKKHSQENPPYKLCMPNTTLETNDHLRITIDPYNIETIPPFLKVKSEEERNNRIKHLFKFITEEYDDIVLDKIIEYISKKYDIKIRTIKGILTKINKTKKEVKREERVVLFKVDNYMGNVERFWNKQPFFYDKSKIFWKWDKLEYKWEIIDEIDIMNSIEKELMLMGETINTQIKNNYLEAIKRYGRIKIPKEAPKKWIQFKDKAFSLTSKKMYSVTPDYFFCNPIPFEMGTNSNTPTINKLFVEWVGESFTPTLFEIIAYCCYTDYPIHLAFCLIGCGRNGKSQFQKLLCKFLNLKNMAAIELDAITNPNNRFETFKLYKKLVAQMGETNFGIINHSSTFKKLTGGDLMGYEKKGKDGFDDYSYAKLMINSNSLPTSADTSEGFYRRWLIIDFPNKFPEGKDIIESIPEEEYNALAKRVTEILPKLLETGKFTNQGTIEQRKEKYVSASNPLVLFINKYCMEDSNGNIRFGQFYTKYTQFLSSSNKRIVSKIEFSRCLGLEGYEIRRTTKDGEYDRYIEGLRFKEGVMDFEK